MFEVAQHSDLPLSLLGAFKQQFKIQKFKIDIFEVCKIKCIAAVRALDPPPPLRESYVKLASASGKPLDLWTFAQTLDRLVRV